MLKEAWLESEDTILLPYPVHPIPHLHLSSLFFSFGGGAAPQVKPFVPTGRGPGGRWSVRFPRKENVAVGALKGWRRVASEAAQKIGISNKLLLVLPLAALPRGSGSRGISRVPGACQGNPGRRICRESWVPEAPSLCIFHKNVWRTSPKKQAPVLVEALLPYSPLESQFSGSSSKGRGQICLMVRTCCVSCLQGAWGTSTHG
uniref:uncharacterized protein LOC132680398 n=1 Tax=Panthera onca TaxID=9690 RepID=UPI0029533080|nr:uncharacterized protein LOC132680398 [Panthera onca]